MQDQTVLNGLLCTEKQISYFATSSYSSALRPCYVLNGLIFTQSNSIHELEKEVEQNGDVSAEL